MDETLHASDLLNTQGQTPDISRNSNQILANSFGVAAEINAHGGPSGTPIYSTVVGFADWLLYDGGPADIWLPQILRDYKLGRFSTAYTEMGSLVHEIEDQNSPTHAANIAHGFFDGFEYNAVPGRYLPPISSLGNSIDSHPEVVDWSTILDYYTFVASENQARLPDYVDVSTGSQYWVAAGNTSYDGLGFEATDGRYGGPFDICDPDEPTVCYYKDIFSPTKSGAVNIITNQSVSASQYAAGLLDAISRKLPPVASQMAIGGAGGGAPPIINNLTGSDVSFFVSENRSQNVKVSLFIKEAPAKKIVTDGAAFVLNDLGNPFGDNQSGNRSAAQTWDANPVDLFKTNPTNLNLLPFKTEFHLTWKGVVAGGDGAPLADGNYTLCLNVRDADEINSSAAADLCDTSVRFIGVSV